MSLQNRRYRVADHVELTVIDGAAIVLDGRRGKYLGLNEVATRILTGLKDDGDPERVLECLLGDYDAPEAQVRADVERMVRELEEKGLVELEPSET